MNAEALLLRLSYRLDPARIFIVLSIADESKGSPGYFPEEHFEEILAQEGDRGDMLIASKCESYVAPLDVPLIRMGHQGGGASCPLSSSCRL